MNLRRRLEQRRNRRARGTRWWRKQFCVLRMSNGSTLKFRKPRKGEPAEKFLSWDTGFTVTFSLPLDPESWDNL